MSTPPQGEASSGNSVVTYSTFWSCEIFEVDNHADIRVPHGYRSAAYKQRRQT